MNKLGGSTYNASFERAVQTCKASGSAPATKTKADAAKAKTTSTARAALSVQSCADAGLSNIRENSGTLDSSKDARQSSTCTTTAARHDSKQREYPRTNFMDVPRELRVRTNGFVYTPSNIHSTVFSYNDISCYMRHARGPVPTAILRTNKLIHEEAEPVL